MGKVMSQEETLQLIKKAQAGSEEALETLVEGHKNLVWKVAQRYRNIHSIELEDVAQLGMIGLIKSIEKFDFSYGSSFSTYAVPTIRGEITRYLRDNKMIKTPRAVVETLFKIVKHDLLEESPETIQKVLQDGTSLGIIEEALRYIRSQAERPTSLETQVSNSEKPDEKKNLEIMNQLQGDVNGDWFTKLAVREAVSMLDDTLRKVIELRYFQDYTQEEIGEVLGISQVHVSRLEKRAKEALRKIWETEESSSMAKGDREKAISLLESSTLTLKEISGKTGVPLGSLGYLAKKYRPKSVSRDNQKKGGPPKKSPALKTEEPKVMEQPTLDINDSIKSSSVKAVLPSSPTERVEIKNVEPKTVKEVDKTAGLATVSFNFNIDVEGEKVNKEEALEKLRNAVKLLEYMDTDTVTFKVKVGN